jgi:predicted Zn-dependent protease
MGFRVDMRCSAIALTMAATLATFPLHAAEKGDPSLGASAQFRQSAQAAQTSLQSGDLAGASGTIGSLSPATPLEKYLASSLAMELAVRRNDVVGQRKAVAQILESGGAPQQQLPWLNSVAGYLSYQTGAMDNAATYLARARSLGVTDSRTALMLVETYARQRKPADAAKLLDEVISAQVQARQPVPASWYDRAASLAYGRKDWVAVSRYNAAKLASVSPTAAADWRTPIVTYLEWAPLDPEAKLDLYRLQAATGGLASERDFEGYAALAAAQGYAAEAKSIVDVGQSTENLTASNATIASLMKTVKSKAAVHLAAIRGLPGKSASVSTAVKASKGGDDLMANSQFAEAAAYYHAALDKNPADRDRVMTRYGIALARSGDLDGARAAFSQVTGQWAQVAAYWNAWVLARAAAQASGAPATTSATPAGATRAAAKPAK